MVKNSWRKFNLLNLLITYLSALQVVLGSLYQDELFVEPAEVVPLLATATLLQLDGVIDQCVAIMEETVNAQVILFRLCRRFS